MQKLTDKQITLLNDMENMTDTMKEANNRHREILERIAKMLRIDF